MGGDIQQKVADISDVIFKMDTDRLPERICGELKYAANRLEAVRLPDAPPANRRAAALDEIEKAGRETEQMISLLSSELTEIYKADAAYSCLRGVLEDCSKRLSYLSAQLGSGEDKSSVTLRHISDLRMSVTVAHRYITMADGRREYLRFLVSGINSVLVNTVPLWRGALISALENPVRENMSRLGTLKEAMTTAVRDMLLEASK